MGEVTRLGGLYQILGLGNKCKPILYCPFFVDGLLYLLISAAYRSGGGWAVRDLEERGAYAYQAIDILRAAGDRCVDRD